MTDFSSLVLFTILLAVFLQGGMVVIESISSDHLGSFTYSWETQYNTDLINESDMDQNFTLQRISEMEDPYLWVQYSGGNASDQVFVNDNLVGNLTGVSPDTVVFDAALLEVDTVVTYDFVNDTLTNVTAGNLTYYRFDGCDYGEETCRSLNVVRDSSNAGLWGVSVLPLLFGGLLVVMGAVLIGRK